MITSIEDLERVLGVCKANGVTCLKLGDVEFEMAPTQALLDLSSVSKKVTDEEILHNPYAGME